MRVQNRYDDMFFINTLVNVLVCRVINDRVKDGNNSFGLLNEEAEEQEIQNVKNEKKNP